MSAHAVLHGFIHWLTLIHRYAYIEARGSSMDTAGASRGPGPLVPSLGLAIVGVVALDQLSKALIMRHLEEGQATRCLPLLAVRFRHSTNRHPGLGFQRGRYVLVGSAVGMFAGVALLTQLHGAVVPIAIAVAVGGAIGNIIDWGRCGHIVDFVDVGVWPVFNLADVAISFGAAIAMLAIVAESLGSGS